MRANFKRYFCNVDCMSDNFIWSKREKREMAEMVASMDTGTDTVKFKNVQEFINALR